MKILFISSFLLFKNTRFGGAKRLYYFANRLAKDHQLFLICFDGCGEINDFRKFNQTFEKFYLIDQWRPKTVLGKIRYVHFDVTYVIKKQHKQINDFLFGVDFDVILACFPLSLSFIKHSPIKIEKKRISYLEDDLLFIQEQKRVKYAKSPLKKIWKLFRYLQGNLHYQRCLRGINSFISISKEEEQVVNKVFPHLKTVIIKYGIDPDNYPMQKFTRKPVRFGFIGNYNHTPNSDAIVWFVDKIFPYLIKQCKDLCLYVAGKNIPPIISNNSNIYILNEVEELSDFYTNIDIFINPIISGRGLRTKLVEAAAFGKPIISTALGAEGLEELRILIAESKNEFWDKTRLLLYEKKKYCEIAEYNRKRVENDLNFNQIFNKLVNELVRVSNH